MTSYNRADYIAEAIESVLSSTYKDFELIISDDCSTDNTLEIAKSYAAKDSRVKVFQNENNLKDYPNRNKAASYASGKYIKYLDSDDAIYPEGLAYCVYAMEQFPEAGMGTLFFQQEISGKEPVCWKPGKTITHHFFVKGTLNVGPSGTIFNRECFEAMGRFDERFGVASDNFLNIRIAAKYPVVLMPKEFFYYRIHEGQEGQNRLGYIKHNYLYLNELFKNGELPLSPMELQKLKKQAGKSFSKELLRYLAQTRDLPAVLSLMNETMYSSLELVKNLLSRN